MNTAPDNSQIIKGYRKAILGMAGLMLFFLVLSNILLLRYEKKQHLANFRAQSVFELEEAAAFMVEPLLKNEFSVVHQFIQNWAESHKNVIRLEASTPKGYTISSFQREAPSDFQISLSRRISYASQHLLTLHMTKDYAEIESILRRTKYLLTASSLLIVCALGICLWYIFRRLAIKPLEAEIAKRLQAEHRLAAANKNLDQKVKQRTQELSDKNQGLLNEIQQRETAENLLATEKEQLTVTLRSIGDGVITTDIHGAIVLMNKVAENLTGWDQDEAIGKPLEEVFKIIDETSGAPCQSPVPKVIDTGQIIGLANHIALIAKDGSKKNIADSGAPIRDKQSRIIGVVLVFRDITDHLRIEQELIKVKKLESIAVLAGGIAHDFNNILAAILGNINLASFDQDLKPRTRNLLAAAEKASLRAKDLTQQLLTFAKGGQPIKEVAALDTVIRDSANFILRGEKVSCQFEIPENLWLVDIDKGQISQVIQNLVLNASHAMPAGGIITVSCENVTSGAGGGDYPLLPEGRFVKITVTDQGIGIPADLVDKIFDPYFTTKPEGSGLGLAITHSIVSKHGGRITVNSAPGIGTTFMLYLPASQREQAPSLQATSVPKATAKAKILLMDDDKMVRNVGREMLGELGHETVLAENGDEAVKLYREAADRNHKFDLVIMDLTIPGGMGGKEAVQELLNLDPEAKVIVSSGYSNDPVMAAYQAYGFCGAVVKPYQLQELAYVIGQILA